MKENKYNSLHTAVQEGNEEKVKSIISQIGIDVNLQDKDGNTPLHIAAQNGMFEIIQILMTLPQINLNKRNNKGDTPVHHAINYEVDNSINLVGLLILMTAPQININARNNEGDSFLHLAAKKGKSDIIEILMTLPKININAKNDQGNTPLHCAIIYGGSEDTIQILLKNGADIELENENGKNPMDLAMINDYQKAVIITRNAMRLAKIDKKAHPKYIYTGNFFNLQNGKRKKNMLQLAIEEGNIILVEKLLKVPNQKFDLNQKDTNGYTPLQLAIRLKETEIANLLIKTKQEVFSQIIQNFDYDNNMAELLLRFLEDLLLYIFLDGFIINVSAQKMIDLNQIDKNGDSLLHLAIKYQEPEILESLIATEKINLNQLNNDGDTPLHLAIRSGDYELVIQLINAGADLNLPNGKNGQTILHLAIHSGEIKIIKILVSTLDKLKKLENCLDIKIGDYNNTLFEEAIRLGNLEIVEFLIEILEKKGKLKDNLTISIFKLVIEQQNAEILEFLIKIPLIDQNQIDEICYIILDYASRSEAICQNNEEIIKTSSDNETNIDETALNLVTIEKFEPAIILEDTKKIKDNKADIPILPEDIIDHNKTYSENDEKKEEKYRKKSFLYKFEIIGKIITKMTNNIFNFLKNIFSKLNKYIEKDNEKDNKTPVKKTEKPFVTPNNLTNNSEKKIN